MLKKIFMTLSMVLLPLAAFASAERGSKEEAIAMAEAAIAHYEAHGLDSMLASVGDPNNTEFHDRDLYVFVSKVATGMIGHGANPDLIGRDIRGFRDASGAYFGVEIERVAIEEGTGWVDYVWPNPTTSELQAKSSYIAKFGEDMYVGVGIYKP